MLFTSFGRPVIFGQQVYRHLTRLYSTSWVKAVNPKFRNVGRTLPESNAADFPELKHLVKDSKTERLRVRDRVLPNQQLIYRAPNGTRLVITYISVQALGLLLLGLCGHYVYVHAADLLSSFADIDVDPLPAAFCTCVFALFVILATRGILRRSALRIYLNPDTTEFTLIKLSTLLRHQRITFTPADVKHIPSTSYFLALYTGSAKIHNCYYYLDPQCFAKPSFYNLLMGTSWEGHESTELGQQVAQDVRYKRR